MLHVISARCGAPDLHTIAPGPSVIVGDGFRCSEEIVKISRIAPFHAIIKTLAVFVDLTKAFNKAWKGGGGGWSSLQAPKEESLRQDVLVDSELLVPEISKSRA